MPIVSMKEILDRAFEERYGVAAFNIVNDLTLEAVLAAAVELKAPLIVQTSVKTVKQYSSNVLYAMFREMAKDVPVPVTLHLDHCPKRDVISECLQAGWNSVLFDASELSVEENKRQTIEVVAEARKFGAHVRYVPEYNLIMRRDAPNDDKVSIIQGSGSGHEPAHVCVVGRGMLDAACPGDVFAGPPVDYVYETTKLLNSKRGILHLVNNYTGDRLAFEMGREMCEADGMKVETVIVDDDVAVKDSTYTAGRRGVAGNFFVIKAVGAAAERGAELNELVALAKRVNSVTRTMGVALSSCTPPAKGAPLFEIGDGEMEIGIGIHGEPGRRRTKLTSADQIVDLLLEAVVTDLPYNGGDGVALMINGLGGTPIGELYLLYGRAHERLAAEGINVRRSYVGEYCTSLEMAGASLTLVRLDDELLALLEAPAEVACRVF